MTRKRFPRTPYVLFLDDERTPLKSFRWSFPSHWLWVVVRSVEEAKEIVLERGRLLKHVCFDHDMGEGKDTGYDFAKWLVEQDMDKKISISKSLTWSIHSGNPIGSENIDYLLKNYFKNKFQKKKEDK